MPRGADDRWRASIVRPRYRADRRRARRRTDRGPSVPAAVAATSRAGAEPTRSGSRAGRVSRPDSTSTASCSSTLRCGGRQRAATSTSTCSTRSGPRAPCASHHARPAAGSCSARGSTTDGSPRSTAKNSAPGSSSTAGSTAGTCPRRTLPRTVTFRWTAQRTVTIGLWLSRLAVVMCIALAVLYRPRHSDDAARAPRLVGFGRERRTSRRRVVAGPAVAAVVALLLAGPGWALVALAVGVCRRGAGPVPIAGRRGAGDLAGVRGDRAVARRAVPTVPERRVAEHVRGPSPPRHARARPARRVAGDPDRRSHERPHGGPRGAPTDTCPGGHRAATRSSLAYS